MHEDAIKVLRPRRRARRPVLAGRRFCRRAATAISLPSYDRAASDDDIHRDMLRAAITWTRVKREQDGKLTGGGKAGEDETPDEDWKRAPK